MDFSCFQPHTGICNYLQFDSYMQENGHCYELHPVDHPFEAIGDYRSGSMLPSATFNDLQYSAERGTKKPIFDHAASIDRIRTVESQLHLLTPKTEVSHLTENGLVSYKACETNGRFVPRKETYSISLKRANVVKGQWTPEEDR